MIVIRFKVKCKPDKVDQAKSAFKSVIAASRAVEGVINFDIAHDLYDPTCIIATEVFYDKAALERQEALPEIQSIIKQLPEWLAGDPEATIYYVSSSEPWG